MTIIEIKNLPSKCCNALVLDLPKYRSYDMSDNPTIKVCSKCKNKLNKWIK